VWAYSRPSGITDVARNRYTAKACDPTCKIPDEDVEKIRLLLRFSPSGTNVQP